MLCVLCRSDRDEPSERLSPLPLQRPCDHFKADLTAQKFGLCACGWLKTDHNEAAIKAERIRADDIAAEMRRKEYTACSRYEPNVNAAAFGECICGRPRVEHSGEALTPKRAKRKSQLVENMLERERQLTPEKCELKSHLVEGIHGCEQHQMPDERNAR